MTASKWGDKDILAAAQQAAADAAQASVKLDGTLDQLLDELLSSGSPPLMASAHAARCSKELIHILEACRSRGGAICAGCRDSVLGAAAGVLINIVAALPDAAQLVAMNRFALAVRRQADMHPKIGSALREFLARSADPTPSTEPEEAP